MPSRQSLPKRLRQREAYPGNSRVICRAGRVAGWRVLTLTVFAVTVAAIASQSAYPAAGRAPAGRSAPQAGDLLAWVQMRVLGPDHPDTLTSRGNLAPAYQDAGRTAEAEALRVR